MHRERLSQCGDDLHAAAAGLTSGNVNLEHPGEQASPCEAMAAPGGVGVVATRAASFSISSSGLSTSDEVPSGYGVLVLLEQGTAGAKGNRRV